MSTTTTSGQFPGVGELVFRFFDLDESIPLSFASAVVTSIWRYSVLFSALFSAAESMTLAEGEFSWVGKLNFGLALMEAWSVAGGGDAIGFGEETRGFDGVAAAELGWAEFSDSSDIPGSRGWLGFDAMGVRTFSESDVGATTAVTRSF